MGSVTSKYNSCGRAWLYHAKNDSDAMQTSKPAQRSGLGSAVLGSVLYLLHLHAPSARFAGLVPVLRKCSCAAPGPEL